MSDQLYAIIKNGTNQKSSFKDHQGTVRTLEPLSHKGDSVKIIVTDIEANTAANRYAALRKASFFIWLSDGLKLYISERKELTKITSSESINAKTAKRVDHLRKTTKEKQRLDRVNKARLNYAKVNAKVVKGETDDMVSNKDEKSKSNAPRASYPVQRRPKVEEITEAPKTEAPKIESPKTDITGLDQVTHATLAVKPRTELLVFAKDLNLTVRPGISKRGLVNTIMAELQPA